MLNTIRHAVSKKKRRYKEDGFDLDLAYITTRIIAMGFPSENVEGLYRNPMNEVIRFLDLKHPNRYKVYNLCSERSYDSSKFYGRVAHYPFDDHNAPPFKLFHEFCVDVKAWLEDPENIVVVHCKAGKGRTGVMICAYLLFSGEIQSVDEVLKFYGEARTINGKGVTIPSQIRYIGYWSHSLSRSLVYKESTCFLNGVEFSSGPKNVDPNHIYFSFFRQRVRIFKTKRRGGNVTPLVSFDTSHAHLTSKWKYTFSSPLPLSGDIKFLVYHQDRLKKKETLFQVWFNTTLHLSIKESSCSSSTPSSSSSPSSSSCWTFSKFELDKANKDKKHKKFDANFQVTLHFSLDPSSTSSFTHAKNTLTIPFTSMTDLGQETEDEPGLTTSDNDDEDEEEEEEEEDDEEVGSEHEVVEGE